MKKLIFFICIVLLCSAGMTGCKNDASFTDGDFVFVEYKEHVSVKDISAIGKEKEVLVVPSTTKDKPVKGFGGTFFYAMISPQSTEAKKLIFSDFSPVLEYSFREMPNLETIIFNYHGEEPPVIKDTLFKSYEKIETVNIYVPADMLQKFKDAVSPATDIIKSRIFEANITFFDADDGNEKFYWCDFAADGEKLLTPPVPQKADSEFLGWRCSEEEALWDFDQAVNGNSMTLYAVWRDKN